MSRHFDKTINELEEKLKKAPYGNKLAAYDVDSGKILEMWPKDVAERDKPEA